MPYPRDAAAFKAEINNGLILTFTCVAAKADADLEQSVRLQEEVAPMLEAYRADGDIQPMLDKVQEVMGADWRPTGDWGTSVEALREV